MTDIRNGVNAGKTVTVHDTQITLNGWSGTGYTILDPESGAGAYMIGVGLDGGFTTIQDSQGSKDYEANIEYPKSSNFHLKKFGVAGFELEYKTEYGLIPNSHFDICACKDGAVFFASPAGSCNKPGAKYTPSYERWKNPVQKWEAY